MANTGKTKVMVFGTANKLGKLPTFDIKLNGTPLQIVNTYKYLGITLDNHLTYIQHVNKTIGIVTAKIKQFQCMRGFLNTNAALMVYKNMLLPILEYGDIFLTAASSLNKRKLQVLQNKGLRCALGRDIETSINDLHEVAGLLQLKFRREQHLLNFMYDQAQIASKLKCQSISTYRTRSSNKKMLKVKRPYTEKFKRSLAYVGPKKWNKLPAQFHLAQDKYTYKSLVGKLVKDRDKSIRTGQVNRDLVELDCTV